MAKSGTTSGHFDIWFAFGSGWSVVRCTPNTPPQPSPITPNKGILWPRVILLWVRLAFGQPLVSCISQTPYTPYSPTPTPLPPAPVEASSGQEWYYVRSAWHVDSLWVRLTFGQIYPHCHPSPVEASSGQEWYFWVSLTSGQALGKADLWSDVPPTPTPHPQQRLLLAKSDTTLSQLNMWSAFGQMYHHPPICPITPTPPPHPIAPCPPVEASSDQEWLLWVNLTFGQPLGQIDLWSDVPPAPQCP